MQDFIMNDNGSGDVNLKLNNNAFQDRDGFIIYYSPQCPHCRNFVPTVNELADKISKYISIGTVNCDDAVGGNKILADLFNISYLPMIKYYNHMTNEFIDYSGGRDIESLLHWLCQVRNICHS